MNTNVIEPITAEGVGTEKQDGDFTMKKAYTFRKLNSTDTFLMFRIVGKIGINEFTACFEKDAVKKLKRCVEDGRSTLLEQQMRFQRVIRNWTLFFKNNGCSF